jgi:hypothetical protein
MAKNNKPILSVLVDEEKKERFSALAKENNYSMGWLLNQAIDKMLEAGTIHIYRDSIASTPSNIAPSADIEELVRSYVEKAITPLSNEYVQKNSWDDLRADVADLRSQLTELKTDNDMTAASIKRLIAEAISKASIDTHTDFDPAAIQIYIDQQIDKLRAQITAIGAKPASIATTTAKTHNDGSPSREVLTVVNRIIADPGLKILAEAALANGLKGKALIDYLFEKGYGANNNSKPFDSSVGSRFQPAIKYLNSINNGSETNG